MSVDVDKITLSIKEVCQATSFGPTKVNELIATGALPSVKVGRRRLVSAEGVRALVLGEHA